MTSEEERDIRTRHAGRVCDYAGRCNSSRCQVHGLEARAMASLLAEIDRLRARLDAAEDVVSEIGCDCTCHVANVDDGEHDADCDGPCSTCRIAAALWPEQYGGPR